MPDSPPAADAWQLVAAERRAFADFVDTLSEAQLDSPSLCAGWRVRDVVGHVTWVATTEAPEVVREVLLGGFKVHPVIQAQGVLHGSLDTDTVRSRLRAAIDSRIAVPTVNAASLTADTLVHHQDIRRPLGLPRDIDPAALRVALDRYVPANRFTGGRKRTKGLRLVATDLDWSHGSGPEVTGPAEALLLATVGRGAALADLSGQGVATLTARI